MTAIFRHDNNTAIVKTDRGTVQGYEWKGLTIFKGIPYATARRFHRPEKKYWDGILDATNFGYVCPLLEQTEPKGELLVPHRYWPMDENCQNLNIWTPGLDDARRPVMVWLHGGGYESGSAIEHIAYEGESMAREGDAVVVSINHRLNMLGYFDLSDFGAEYENSGNAGGDDIIAALQFVHDNIALFGGDPGNVTVFGQSGGGAKVTTLLQSPEADGLYAKGYNMSGVIGPLLADATGSGREFADAVMAELGLLSPADACTATVDNSCQLTDAVSKDHPAKTAGHAPFSSQPVSAEERAAVKRLETVDCRDMLRAYVKLRPSFRQQGKYTGGTPHPNAHYLGEPTIHGWRKETQNIPLLVGSCFAEFTSFGSLPYDRLQMSLQEQEAMVEGMIGPEGTQKLIPLFTAAYPERPIVDILQLDFIFRSPEIEYIRSRSAVNPQTYSYLFNMDQPINGGQAPWHCSDIPYVFHNTDLVPYPNGDTAAAGKMEKEIFDSVMAFARTGSPACAALPGWKASTPAQEATMVLDAHPQTRINYDHDLIAAQARYTAPAFQKIMASLSGDIQH